MGGQIQVGIVYNVDVWYSTEYRIKSMNLQEVFMFSLVVIYIVAMTDERRQIK